MQLDEYIKKYGLSKRKVAHDLGICISYIGKYTKNKINMRLQRALMIEAYTNGEVRVTDMYDGDAADIEKAEKLGALRREEASLRQRQKQLLRS